MPKKLIVSLTFFVFSLVGQSVNLVQKGLGEIKYLEPLGNYYSVIGCISSSSCTLYIFDKDHKLVFSIKEGESGMKGGLISKDGIIDPVVNISWSQKVFTWHTFCPNRILFRTEGACEAWEYNIEQKKARRILGIGDRITVPNAGQFREMISTGDIGLFAPVFPGVNGKYYTSLEVFDPQDGKIKMEGTFEIDSVGAIKQLTGLTFQLSLEQTIITPKRVVQAPTGELLFMTTPANTFTQQVSRYNGGGPEIIFSNTNKVFQVPDAGTETIGPNIDIRPDVINRQISVYSWTGNAAIVYPKILDTLVFSSRVLAGKYNWFYVQNGLGAVPIGTDKNRKVFNAIGIVVPEQNDQKVYEVLLSSNTTGGMQIGPIGLTVAPMECSVIGYSPIGVFEKPLAVIKSALVNGKNLEIAGCFPGANRDRGVSVFANGVDILARQIELLKEYNDRKIVVEIPPTLGGETEIRVAVFTNTLPPTQSINSARVNIPMVRLEFNPTSFYYEVSPGAEFKISASANQYGKLEVRTTDPERPVVLTDLGGTEFEFNLKTRKSFSVILTFVSENGQRLERTIEVKVLPPSINGIIAANEGKPSIGEKFYVQGFALSFDGEEHGNGEEPLDTDTKVSINGVSANVFFISEATLIIQVPENLVVGDEEENWLTISVNGQEAAYRMSIKKENKMMKK